MVARACRGWDGPEPGAGWPARRVGQAGLCAPGRGVKGNFGSPLGAPKLPSSPLPVPGVPIGGPAPRRSRGHWDVCARGGHGDPWDEAASRLMVGQCRQWSRCVHKSVGKGISAYIRAHSLREGCGRGHGDDRGPGPGVAPGFGPTSGATGHWRAAGQDQPAHPGPRGTGGPTGGMGRPRARARGRHGRLKLSGLGGPGEVVPPRDNSRAAAARMRTAVQVRKGRQGSARAWSWSGVGTSEKS